MPGEFPYDRPPLSKEYLRGDRGRSDLALARPGWYDDNVVRLVAQTTVTALRPGERQVELSRGRPLRADRVVLATGGRAARLPIPGADSPRVHVLRTVDDADRLRAALKAGTRLLVIGAGLIGAEVASTALELGVTVTLVDPVAIPLEAVFGTEIGGWLHRRHAERGIDVVPGSVTGLRDTDAGIVATLDGGGGQREFDAVLLAVGLRPEISLAESAGLTVDDGIVVNEGQVTSHPWLLAVGDATRRCVAGRLLPRAEHWEAAQHDGARAAATLLGEPPPAPTAPWFWTDRHHLHVEVVGHPAEATALVHRGTLGQGPFSQWGLRGGRVVAVVAVDDPKAVRTARRLIDRGIPVQPDLLADPSFDLRSLLRQRRVD